MKLVVPGPRVAYLASPTLTPGLTPEDDTDPHAA